MPRDGSGEKLSKQLSIGMTFLAITPTFFSDVRISFAVLMSFWAVGLGFLFRPASFS